MCPYSLSPLGQLSISSVEASLVETSTMLQTGIRACVAGGKLVVVGLGGETATLPIASAACKEIDIIGSFRYCNTVSPSLSLCFTILGIRKIQHL